MNIKSILEGNPQAKDIENFIAQFQSQLSNKIINKAKELCKEESLDQEHILYFYYNQGQLTKS